MDLAGGGVLFDLGVHTLDRALYLMACPQPADVNIQNVVADDKISSYFRLMEHFVRAVDGDSTADIPTPTQALISVQIVDAISRSAAAGREVVLE